MKKILVLCLSLFIAFIPFFNYQNVQAARLNIKSFPSVPSNYFLSFGSLPFFLTKSLNYYGNIRFKTDIALEDSEQVKVNNGGAYLKKDLIMNDQSKFKTEGSTYVVGKTVINDEAQLYIKNGDAHFNEAVLLKGDHPLTVQNGYVYFYNSFELEDSIGTSFQGNGGVIFSDQLTVKGTSSAEIENDVTLQNTAVDVSGNSEIVIKGDLYVDENTTFDFKDAGKICVQGFLYYDGATPPAHMIGSCSESTVPGLYVESVINKESNSNGQDQNVSLDFAIEPKQETYYIDDATEVATATIGTNIMPQGEIDVNSRIEPMDVIFMFDSSTSMTRGLLTELLGSLLGIDSQLELAMTSIKESIDILRNNVVDGDRIGVISFDRTAKIEVPFNNEAQTADEIKEHLDDIKERLDEVEKEIKKKRRSLFEDTNYDVALQKANEMFGNSDRAKYVIFLTDGRAQDMTNDTVVKDIDGFFELRNCLFCKKEYIKAEDVVIKNNFMGHRSEFDYDGHTYKYSKILNVSDIKTIDEAEKLATTKHAKVYAVEIRSKNRDEEFLSMMTSITGGKSYSVDQEEDLIDATKHIINLINQLALRQIQVKINLQDVEFPPDSHVSIPDDSELMKSEDGNYLLLNIPDIEYKAGEGTPISISKAFDMHFDKSGQYKFNDVVLTYKDFTGEMQTVRVSPLIIHIQEKGDYGLQFKEPIYVIDVKAQMSKNLKDQLIIVESPTDDTSEKPKVEDLTFLSWESSDEKIATVSADGTVLAKGCGDTLITVKAIDDKERIKTASTWVKTNVKSLEFDQTLYEFPEEVPDGDMFDKLIVEPHGFYISRDVLEWKFHCNDVPFKFIQEGSHNEGIIMQDGNKTGFAQIIVRLKDEYNQIDGNNEDIYDQAKTFVKINCTKTELNNGTNEW